MAASARSSAHRWVDREGAAAWLGPTRVKLVRGLIVDSFVAGSDARSAIGSVRIDTLRLATLVVSGLGEPGKIDNGTASRRDSMRYWGTDETVYRYWEQRRPSTFVMLRLSGRDQPPSSSAAQRCPKATPEKLQLF